MKVKNLIGVMVLVLLSLVSLQAGVIPGRWEKLDGQPSGTRMLVTLNSGERMDCALSSSGALDLTVTDQTGTERVLPKSEVRKIVSATREVRDNVMKGTLIGAIVGGLAVLPFAAIIENETGQRDAMMTVVGYAGIGAGIGAAVDWAIDRERNGSKGRDDDRRRLRRNRRRNRSSGRLGHQGEGGTLPTMAKGGGG